jgi:BirA family biotin operon repressor/biotin-[acetyl-CoA-carboxylase] ligase
VIAVPFMTDHMIAIGRKRLFKPSTGSTNSDLMRMAADNPALEGGLVLRAGEQTAGKGRQGRGWIAAPGDTLCFSILLKPDIAPQRAASLPLVAGAATAKAVEAFCPNAGIGIKWPNDIVAGGRKLCGILCEMSAEGDHVRHIVVGIGVNLSIASLPPALSNIATSIEDISGNRPDAETVMDAILLSLDGLYREWLLHGFGHVLPEVARRDILRGGHVRIDAGGKLTEGTAMGIAPDGSLLIMRADGTPEHVYSGDAHLLGR